MFKREKRSKPLCLEKIKSDRKPLIITGARQVGKTTLIKQFANTYKHQTSVKP